MALIKQTVHSGKLWSEKPTLDFLSFASFRFNIIQGGSRLVRRVICVELLREILMSLRNRLQEDD